MFVKNELMVVVNEYVNDNCDKSGRVKESNISVSQEKSLKELKSRIAEEKLVIYETDKTGNLVVDTLENVEAKMKKHVENDEIISDRKIRSIERSLNNEVDSWIEILQIGKNVNQL